MIMKLNQQLKNTEHHHQHAGPILRRAANKLLMSQISVVFYCDMVLKPAL